MPYYNICPKCGASLDPSEKCDCTAEKKRPPSMENEGRTIGNVENSDTETMPNIFTGIISLIDEIVNKKEVD